MAVMLIFLDQKTAAGKMYLLNDLLQVALFCIAAVWGLWVFILHWVSFPLFCACWFGFFSLYPPTTIPVYI